MKLRIVAQMSMLFLLAFLLIACGGDQQPLPAPKISSVTASTISSEGAEITIRGANFRQVRTSSSTVPPQATVCGAELANIQLAGDIQTIQPIGRSLSIQTSDTLIGTFQGNAKPGNTDVTVTLSDGQTAKLTGAAMCEPEPTDETEPTPSPEPAPDPKGQVISVAISQNDQTMFVGDSGQLQATVATKHGATTDVTWSSSTPHVATVNHAGLITALAEGITTISATSTFDPTKSDTINIEVTDKFAAFQFHFPQANILLALPIQGTGTYVVEWGDGDRETITDPTQATQHQYDTPGTYTVKIAAEQPGDIEVAIRNPSALLAVESWGNLRPTSLSNAFADAIYLHTVPATLPSSVTSLQSTFAWAENFNQDLGEWDTTNVTNMSETFLQARNFNGNVSNWDTSNVTDMSDMFAYATSFNGNLNGWDTSNVTNMSLMFHNASAFNQPLNEWDTGNVTSMSSMFRNARSFNQNLNSWNTSNVTNMNLMFRSATSFNQNLNSWNTSNVTGMSSMFYNASAFNQPLNNWNTSNVTGMSYMFYDASAFNQDLSGWCVQDFTSEPNDFALDAGFENDSAKQPEWGATCN